MPDVEDAFSCPVCSVRMGKMSFLDKCGPVLDFCPRCGGIWFDRGEVASFKNMRPRALFKKLGQNHSQNLLFEIGRLHTENASGNPQKLLEHPIGFYEKYSFRSPCPHCRTLFDRNAVACPACHRKNRIECPVCKAPMRVASYGAFQLDYCESCKGVWFDNIELGAIWNIKLFAFGSGAAVKKEAIYKEDCTGPDLFVDILASDPSIIVSTAEMSVETGKNAYETFAGVVSDVPESAGAFAEATFSLAGSAAESVGEVASGFFETVVEIIGGIFS